MSELIDKQTRDERGLNIDELKSAIDSLDMMVFLVDIANNKVLYVSKGIEPIYGISPQAMYDDPNIWLTFFPMEEKVAMDQERQRWGEGKPIVAVHRIIRRDGASRWIEARTIPMFGVQDKPQYLYGFITDITEKRDTENRLAKSEQQYRSLFEHMVAGFAYCQMIYDDAGNSVDFRYLAVNSAFETLTGLKNVAGKLVTEVIPGVKESNPELFAIYGRVASSGVAEQFETYVAPLNIWFSVSVYSTEKGSFIAVFENITARKTAEDVLVQSKKDLSLSVALAQVAPWRFDPKQGVFIFSDEFYAIYGTSVEREGAIMTPEVYARELVHPEDASLVAKAIGEAMAAQGREQVFRLEHRIVRRDGIIRIIAVLAKIIKDVDGKIIEWYGANQDITDQKESEERFRTVVQNVPDVIWSTDEAGNTIFMSPQVFAIYGYTAEEIMGNSSLWFGRIHPDDTIRVRQAFDALIKQGIPFDIEYRIQKKDGTWLWAHDRAKGVRIVGGKKVVDGIFSDITHKKTEEAELVKMRKALQTSLDIIFETDAQGIITYINDMFTRTYGYTAEEVIGKVTPRILKSGVKTPQEYEQLWKTILQKQSVHWEIVNKAKDGQLLTMDATITPIIGSDGELVGFMAAHRDITMQQKQEQRIKNLNDLRMKFIQIVSHQLRTPLGSIRWNLESILDGSFGELTEGQKQFLRVTYDADVDVLGRINDLLIIMDIEEGRLAFLKENISIESLLGSVLIEMKPKIEGKEIVLEQRLPETPLPPVFVDPQKMRNVFVKLIDNALIYTTAKGTITITLSLTGENKVRFEVKDTGIGVPIAEQQNIFKSFFRATNAFLAKPDASGVGLSIAKYFVEQHGGTVGFVSTEGKGSVFWFELPLASDTIILEAKPAI